MRAHAAPDGTVAILFSDIEDSTILTERLGDERWLQLLRQHNAIFREQIARHEGYEVKSQGDGFMLAFTDPGEAVDCAAAIQRRVSDHDFGGEHLALRVGVHVGKVIREADDFFGRTVILAARVADRATAGEVLVTPEIVAAVPRAIVAEARALALKGLSGTHLAHVLDWRRFGSLP